MGLFGSLVTSASALQAQATSSGFISTNIANINTVGYKRSDASFKDLVTSDGRFAAYSPATVYATEVKRVDVQGAIKQTTSSTDVAITGDGFFAVKSSLLDSEPFAYTRNGNFSGYSIRATADTDPLATEDAGEQAILRNSSGYFLYGFQLDADGEIIGAQTMDNLTPVVITPDLTITRETTSASLSLNLNATQQHIDPHTLATGAQQLPITDQTAAHFSRGMTVYDSAGNGYDMDYQFRRIVGPMAHFSTLADTPLTLDQILADPDNDGPLGGISNGDEFTITLSTGATETYTIVDEATGNDIDNNQVADVRGLLTAINAHGDGTQLSAALDEDGRLIVRSNDLTGTLSLTENSGTPLSGPSTLNVVEDPADSDFTYAPEADPTTDGLANPNQSDFPALANTTDPNPYGWWEVSIVIDDPAVGATPGDQVEVRKALINFNTDGSINAVADADGNIEIDMSTAPIDFDLGSDDGLIGFNVDISDMLQYSGQYTVYNAEQNGADLGLLENVSINAEGYVVATFSNALTASLYRVPVVKFNNENGLNAVDGTAFQQSNISGEPTVNFAGENGSGGLNVNSVEAANVELADEFSKLIVTQRSYSASSRVITTIDEMTSALASLSQ